jgi:nucleoside phosphorylase
VARPRRRFGVALVCAIALTGVLPPLGHAKARGRTALCKTVKKGAKAPYVVIFSAFRAEVEPLVEAIEIDSTTEIGGRPYYLGRIGRVRVVLGITRIGLVNAEDAARTVLDEVDAAAVVFSGVAGSPRRIADVVVVDDWVQRDVAGVFPTNPALRALMRRATLPEPLERCTLVPPTSPSGAFVCMPFEPSLVLGGHGTSDDPYGDNPVPCGADGEDIFGCDLPAKSMAVVTAVARGTAPEPDAVDQETAAVARVAAERDVPFLGVRGVSDGAGDPLGVRPFPQQFFDYYVLAARNAAIVTRALVASIEDLARSKSGRRACRLLAKRQWERAAEKIGP